MHGALDQVAEQRQEKDSKEVDLELEKRVRQAGL